jgi:PAS domain S-box-containing protein
MKKSSLHIAAPAILLSVTIILLDVVMDRLVGGTVAFNLPRVIFASVVVVLAFISIRWSTETRQRAEAVLRQARDDLAERVAERTAELEQTNEALRTSEETARALMNAMPESAVLLDTEGAVLASNATAATRLGVTVGQMAGSSLFDFFPPDVAERRRPYLDRIRQEQKPLYFIDEREGRIFDNHLHPVFGADGRMIRIAVFGQDITERKRSEARIHHLSSFPALNPNPVVEVNASGAITFVNPSAAAALARLRLGDDASQFLPADMAKILESLAEGQESGFLRDVHLGDAIFAESIQVIPSSEVVRVYAFDITKRVRAEDALRASEEKYRLLFQNMAEGFALYELLNDEQGVAVDWRVLEVNKAYESHTGIAPDRIVGRRISELFPDAIPEYLPRFAQVVATRTPIEWETYARVVDRHHRVSTFSAGGNRFASVIEDITERRRSEAALRQAQADLALDLQKRTALEERQRLARELHDSVSQALYGISLGVHTALAQLDTDRAKTRDALDYALSLTHGGLKEMRALIFELRPESLEKEGLIAALTRQVEALSARHNIEVAMSLCDEPDLPLAAKEALYRISLEALQNAIRHARPNRLDLHLACAPDGVTLEVGDDGIGFDPSAEFPGHLGLRSMRERAQALGGGLDLVSSPGCGTRLTVRVPAPVAPGDPRPAPDDEGSRAVQVPGTSEVPGT